jgi:hypothetical protein
MTRQVFEPLRYVLLGPSLRPAAGMFLFSNGKFGLLSARLTDCDPQEAPGEEGRTGYAGNTRPRQPGGGYAPGAQDPDPCRIVQSRSLEHR